MDEKSITLSISLVEWEIAVDKDFLNNGDFEKFNPFVMELVESLLDRYIPLAAVYYEQLKPENKRWFFPDKPAVYEQNGLADRLAQYVQAKQPTWQCSVREFLQTSKYVKYKWQVKALFLTAPQADALFLEKTDAGMRIGEGHDWSIAGFDPVQAVEKSVDELADAYINKQYALRLYVDTFEKRIEITFNPIVLDAKEVLNKIRQTTQKHGYDFHLN